MIYLIINLWPYLLAALTLGLIVGMLSCARYEDDNHD